MHWLFCFFWYIYIYIYILTQKYQAPSYTITSHQTVTDCSTTLVCSGGEVCGTLTCKQGYVLLVEMRIVADFYTSTSQGMHWEVNIVSVLLEVKTVISLGLVFFFFFFFLHVYVCVCAASVCIRGIWRSGQVHNGGSCRICWNSHSSEEGADHLWTVPHKPHGKIQVRVVASWIRLDLICTVCVS